MKELKYLTEYEICIRIMKRKTAEAIYEEITHPDYEVWGRAPQWTLSQTVCLLLGFSPICETFYSEILGTYPSLDSEPDSWRKDYYPITDDDLVKIHNVHKDLQKVFIDLYDDSANFPCSPSHILKVLDMAKNKRLPIPHPDLVYVVKEYGHTSTRIIKDIFYAMEIDPEEATDIYDLCDQKKLPLELQNSPEEKISKEQILDLFIKHLPAYRKEQLGRAVTRIIALGIQKHHPKAYGNKYSKTNLLKHPLAVKANDLFSEVFKEAFEVETRGKWLQNSLIHKQKK